MDIPSSLLLDNRVDCAGQVSYHIKRGAENVNVFHAQADTASTSSMHWSVVPPSPNTIVTKPIDMHFEVEFDLQGTRDLTAGTPIIDSEPRTSLVVTNDLCMRELPMQSVANSIQVNLNGMAFSQNSSDYVTALNKYNQGYKYKQLLAGACPMSADAVQDYDDDQYWGNAKNPFYSPHQDAFRSGRKHFIERIASNPAATGTTATATIRCSWNEPIMVSPLGFGTIMENKGFYMLRNLDVQVNIGNINRLLSMRNNSTTRSTVITAVRVNVAELRITYLTPPLFAGLPSRSLYNYNHIERFPTNNIATGLAAGATTQLTLRNVQPHSIPSRIYLFARQPNTVKAAPYVPADLPASGEGMCDSYALIESISVNFGNKTGQLAELDSFDLYKISVENGLEGCNWFDWKWMTGSVLCLQVDRNLGLEPNQCVGMRGSFSLQVTMNIRNISEYAKDFQGYMVLCSEGVVDITEGLVTSSVGIVYPSDLFSAENLMQLERIPHSSEINYGGSWSGFKRFVRRAFRTVTRGISDHLPAIVKFGTTVAPLIKPLLGLGGMAVDASRAGLVAYPGYGKGISGAGLTGGKGGKAFTKKSLEKLCK